MSRFAHPWPIPAVLGGMLAMTVTAVAPAHTPTPTGGAAAAEEPEVRKLTCRTGERDRCPRGERLRIRGAHLDGLRKVVFLGGRGRRDNRRAQSHAARSDRVVVTVPGKARSGRVRVVTAVGRHDGPRLRVLSAGAHAPAAAAPPAGETDGVFPVRGRHDYGTATNRFGGGRGHQGQDVFAACGARLVAALPGRVTLKRWHERAGHYVVVEADDGTSQVYMHLQGPPRVGRGDRVRAGQRIGEVGATGRASGCHLHFELWTAPGFYEGGEPVDPLPALRRWDAAG